MSRWRIFTRSMLSSSTRPSDSLSPVQTIPWDDRFKPHTWEYDLYRRPDIYVMEYRP
jgi:hypothetical protein